MLSAEQNDSQSEEINVIDEPQTENKPVRVPEQEVEMAAKSLFGRPFCSMCLAVAQNVDHATHLLSRPCFDPSSRVARVAKAPSLDVNRSKVKSARGSSVPCLRLSPVSVV